ncbi:MAG TPA: hypothetical protein VFL55_21640 [Acetobacteraceae bacterium]|jgi:hypothetical protein|nr:hypothetical protein [Acetobacteraceae bacterium]
MWRTGLIALTLAAAGCAGPMGTIRPGPSVPASQAAQVMTVVPPVTAYDGTYRMRLRLTGGAGAAEGNTWCQSGGQPVITVTNGQFDYAVPHPNIPGNPTPVFQATMAADGSFTGAVTSGTMFGRIDGTHMEGKIDGSGCIYAFSGDRA